MKAFRRFFWFVPTVLWMVLIFHLSGQEGTASAGLSYKVAAKTAVIRIFMMVSDFFPYIVRPLSDYK